MEKSEFWIGVMKLRGTLVERYPLVFVARDQGTMKPLAIGIDVKIREQNPDIDPNTLRQFLKKYVHKPRYLKALLDGDSRVNLDGSAASEPTQEQIARAKGELKKRAA